MYTEVSAANAWEYEDKTIQLRYTVNTDIIPDRFDSATCAPQVPKIILMFYVLLNDLIIYHEECFSFLMTETDYFLVSVSYSSLQESC